MEDLFDRKKLREFLERHGIWARKGLAQHFLCSKLAVEAILGRLKGFSGALEIGPGPGVLTGPLSESLKKVIALEIDDRMVAALTESAPKASVRLGDVLETDFVAILNGLPMPRAIVSNMPYHITGPLLTRIAEARRSFEKAVLMMQKEVAERVLAPAGDSDRGSLSVFLQVQFEIKKVCPVPAGAFYPPPKVDSMVLEFVTRETGLSSDDEKRFFPFVRTGFRMPRKTLANNLAATLGRESSTEALKLAGLALNIRPHMLTLEQWISLWRSSEELR